MAVAAKQEVAPASLLAALSTQKKRQSMGGANIRLILAKCAAILRQNVAVYDRQ